MLQFSFILQFLIWKFANVVGVELEEEIEDQVSDPRAARKKQVFYPSASEFWTAQRLAYRMVQ